MTSLMDIVGRTTPPPPWTEGDNIPWDDPGFSRRMLAFHLDPSHDLASRRTATIDNHVAWIHRAVLGAKPSKLLDLTCGPGLYTARLAALGHECTGVDFSPASISHARETAARQGLACTYLQRDVRRLEPSDVGDRFDLVLMTWGQFNVFPRPEARRLLAFSKSVLNKGGTLLLEPQHPEHLQNAASAPPTWRTEASGLFSDRPHLVLEETSWDPSSRTSTHRFFVVDAQSCQVTRYAMSNEAYSQGELAEVLRDEGYRDVRMYPSMTGAEEPSSKITFVICGDSP